MTPTLQPPVTLLTQPLQFTSTALRNPNAPSKVSVPQPNGPILGAQEERMRQVAFSGGYLYSCESLAVLPRYPAVTSQTCQAASLNSCSEVHAGLGWISILDPHIVGSSGQDCNWTCRLPESCGAWTENLTGIGLLCTETKLYCFWWLYSVHCRSRVSLLSFTTVSLIAHHQAFPLMWHRAVPQSAFENHLLQLEQRACLQLMELWE